MSADKRSLKNFTDFPGSINIDKNIYEFPTLFKKNNNEKWREWKILCRLIKKDSMDIESTKKQNWNVLLENEVPILKEYLYENSIISPGTVCQIWSEGGIIGMKSSRSPCTYIIEPKNIGKKNERNVLQQALIVCRSKYLKKIDDGSVLDKEDKITTSCTKFYPMLAKKYEADKIKYPIYSQPKLDGNRCIIFLDSIDNPTYKNVKMYTRSQKEFPFNNSNDNIRNFLLDILVKNYNYKTKSSIYLDGELYLHNKNLQDINSEVRGQNEKGIQIQYWIYDHFYPYYKNETFKERNLILNKILENCDKNIIINVKTDLVIDKKECDTLYNYYLNNNYEGMMLRTPNGIYLKSSTKKSEQLRSSDLLKRKEIYDCEFKVVDYTEGINGKEVGAVIWICEYKNTFFNVTPNLPINERYKIYKECKEKFNEKYKDRMLTVQYRGFSKYGVPLQAKAIEFRDFI